MDKMELSRRMESVFEDMTGSGMDIDTAASEFMAWAFDIACGRKMADQEARLRDEQFSRERAERRARVEVRSRLSILPGRPA